MSSTFIPMPSSALAVEALALSRPISIPSSSPSSRPSSLPEVKCYNPAFDVTDHSLITAIVTEKGVCYPPFDESFTALFGGKEG